MAETVTVAPREIHDLVYRVSRVAGCDPGTAERIAENVTFAEIHHGAAVPAFCEALDAADLALSEWVTALDVLLAAEVEARSTGRATAEFASEVPLAAIAGTLHHCMERGMAPINLQGEPRGDEAVSVVTLMVAAAGTEASIARITDAHRHGVRIDRQAFNQLEVAAAKFLVSETTLDELE